MQIILTEQEYADLKAKKGVDPEAVAAAKQELIRKLNQTVSDPRGRFDVIPQIRHALHKFDEEISAAIKAAA